jgi:pSer/pThr/pTyr-binding forkhead associated (FHA) protein
VIGNQPDADGGRKVVGVLVSYDTNPRGDVFRIYEGRNIIGRDRTCDVCISNDSKISGKHLLILYREVEGVYWAADQNSSNGTYINGQFVSDRAQLSTNDVIVIGATKMVFLGIPEF